MNKKSISVIIGAIVAVGVSLGVQQLLFQPERFDKQMMKVASELNASCPMMVDQETRLDNAVATPGNKFQYNYTLVNYTKEEIDGEAIKQQLEPGIINNLKTNPDLKIFRDNNVTMVYNYSDKDKIFLFRIEVTPEVYEN